MSLVRKLKGFETADRSVYRQVVDIRHAELKRKYPSDTSNTFGLLWQLIRLHRADISTVEMWDLLPMQTAFLVPVNVCVGRRLPCNAGPSRPTRTAGRSESPFLFAPSP
jgi:hypothetical protein